MRPRIPPGALLIQARVRLPDSGLGSWLTSGWIDVLLTVAWFVFVVAVGARVWRRPGGE